MKNLSGQARICVVFRGLFFKHNPRGIGSAFHPDGIRTSKAFHWAGRASAEIGKKDHLWMDTSLECIFLDLQEDRLIKLHNEDGVRCCALSCPSMQ